ncbi:MAG: 16S rRNA (cytosine(967)-C(5))-methyltransferase RsmB [Gammaproteobacteria bacterium]|nr:16S rRNA (cytosine(967)-C(5))-methyltransferase RsmB [Gammaproteobacteria bacterium]
MAIRAVAARVVHAVRTRGRTLDDALGEYEATVSLRDRPLLRALAFGTVRWWLRLAACTQVLLTRPLRPRDAILADLLAVGLFQLIYLRIPARAAVHATVAATAVLERPHARGLVNALLRRFQREGESLLAGLDTQAAVRHACPDWLVAQLEADWPEHHEALLVAANAAPPMWLRVNRRLGERDAYLERLRAAGLEATRHPEAPEALCLAEPTDVERLPGWAQGAVSVQDAAAQLAAGLLAPGPGHRVLDACAAPGGKTAHLLETTPDLAEMVALDISASRLAELEHGLARLNLRSSVLCGDARDPQDWWDGRPFDRILLDAPCSATGVIRRHPDIKLLRQVSDLDALAVLQADMLEALWGLLAPGGRLLYATCSVLRRENQAQIVAFLQRHPEAALVPGNGSISAPGRQIMTGETNMDGFYYACLQHSSMTS